MAKQVSNKSNGSLFKETDVTQVIKLTRVEHLFPNDCVEPIITQHYQAGPRGAHSYRPESSPIATVI